MVIAKHLALIGLLVFCCSGCSRVIEDVSEDSKYSTLVGREYISARSLNLYAIRVDSGADTISHYRLDKVYTRVNRGPEVVSISTIYPDVRIVIHRVIKCVNCLPSRQTKIQITSPDLDTEDARPIYLSALLLEDVMEDKGFYLKKVQ